MKLLLDTQAFLWYVDANPKLSAKAKLALEDPSAELYLSAASVWEVAIKVGVEKLKLPEPIDRYFEKRLGNSIKPLEVDWRHAMAVAALPDFHKDPFDRMLAAQAAVEGMALVSSDKVFKEYKANVIW